MSDCGDEQKEQKQEEEVPPEKLTAVRLNSSERQQMERKVS